MPVIHYASVDEGLFDAVLNMCVEPGKMCMGEMMAIDRKGGLGLTAVHATWPLVHDKYARRGQAVLGSGESYVMAICTPLEAEKAAVDAARRRQELAVQMTRSAPAEQIMGMGLTRPGQAARTEVAATGWSFAPRIPAPTAADASASQS